MKRELLLTSGLLMAASPALAQMGSGYTPPAPVYAPLNIVVGGADPTGATDAAPIINAELSATPNGVVTNVYAPCGTFHLKSAVTVGTATQGQALEGDGGCTQFDVSNDFTSTATGVILLNGQTPLQLGSQPTVHDFTVRFHQPPDLQCTVATAASAGATTVTLNACSGIVNGDYVVDITTAGAISQQPTNAASTTATVSGNVITISPAVVTGHTVNIGDTLDFAQPRANDVTLASGPVLTAGAPGIIYPPAIAMGPGGSGTVLAYDLRIEQATTCISLYGTLGIGNGMDGPDVHDIWCGSSSKGFTGGGISNFGKLINFEEWNYGFNAMSTLGGGPAFGQRQYDGNSYCLYLDEMDDLSAFNTQCWTSRLVTTTNWTWGSFVSTHMDGSNSDIELNGGSGPPTNFTGGYVTGLPAGGRGSVNISAGNKWIFNSFYIGNGAAANAMQITGGFAGSVSVNSSTLSDAGGFPSVVASNTASASIRVVSSSLLGSGSTLVVLGSLDTLTFVSDVVQTNNTAHAAFSGLVDATANNIQANGFNGWQFTPPGTLGTYQGQVVGPQTLYGTLTNGGTISGGTLSGSITNTSTLSTVNILGAITIESGQSAELIITANATGDILDNIVTGGNFTLENADGVLFVFGEATAGTVADHVYTQSGTAGTPGSVVVGAIGTDTNINLQLSPKGTGEDQVRGHVAAGMGGGTPTAAACEGTGTVAGNDSIMKVTGGSTTSTTCTITFGNAWAAVPMCLVTEPGGTSVTGTASWVTTTGSIVITTPTTDTGAVFSVICLGTS